MVADSDIQLVKRTDTSKAKYSILLPTWNNLPYLQLCIDSIKKNSTFTHQIIVHINEGKDGTLEWVKDQPDIDYSYSKENIGVCYALNSCRTIAGTSYILYINDDMYACPGWDKSLDEEIEKIGHKYFFLSATAIEAKTHHPCSINKDFGTDIGSFNEAALLRDFASFSMNDWQGATWPPNIVHKDIWDLVGGYSTEFSPGLYSDPDFSMKLWQLGVRLFKGVSKSRVYHFGSISLKRVTKNKGYYTFVAKWAITQNTFSKLFLRRGEIFDGPLKEPNLSNGKKMNNIFKQLKAAFLRG